MFDVMIFVKCSGVNARLDNLSDTLLSIQQKIGIQNYSIYLVVDPDLLSGTAQIINTHNLQDKIFYFGASSESWAYDYNTFCSFAFDEAKWIMTVHDDAAFRTSDFFPKIVNMAKGKEEKIGWITTTIDYYWSVLGNPQTCSGRKLFTLDRYRYPCIFECHNFTQELHSHGRARQHMNLLDMPIPDFLVKVPGVMSAVMISPIESAKKIGLCEDWTPYTMLIDEDFSLTASKLNLWNLWASGIYIDHPLRADLRPTWNKWEEQAWKAFYKKWHFEHGHYPDEIVRDVRVQFKDTLIPWSSYRNTFDWEYL